MNNKNLDLIIGREQAFVSGDIRAFEDYEIKIADSIYFSLREKEREKNVLQERYNALKIAADSEKVNPDRIYEDRDMKEAMIINHLRYTSLNSRGRNKSISEVGDAVIGRVFKDSYYRANI